MVKQKINFISYGILFFFLFSFAQHLEAKPKKKQPVSKGKVVNLFTLPKNMSSPKLTQLKQLIGEKKVLRVSFNKSLVSDILKFFSAEYRINIIADPKVQGIASFSLKNVHPAEAFHALLLSLGYSWSIIGDIVYVDADKSYRVIKLKHMSPDHVKKVLGPMIAQKGILSTDNLNNSIILYLPTAEIEKISGIIKELDTPPLQVLVSSKILEVKADNGLSYGLDIKNLNNSHRLIR